MPSTQSSVSLQPVSPQVQPCWPGPHWTHTPCAQWLPVWQWLSIMHGPPANPVLSRHTSSTHASPESQPPPAQPHSSEPAVQPSFGLAQTRELLQNEPSL